MSSVPVARPLYFNDPYAILHWMHILSSHNRSEFLATPQLIRFDYAQGRDSFEPTLLIKGSTLLLKYIAIGVRIQLAFARLDERLLYALKIYDDGDKAGLIWSILERKEEKAALNAIIHGEACQTFLFNELAVNVAWTDWQLPVEQEFAEMVDGATTGKADHAAIRNQASLVLEQLHGEVTSNAGFVVAEVPNVANWNPIISHFITSHATSSPIDLFNENEGSQQEQIGVWLTDSLHPFAVCPRQPARPSEAES